MSYINCARCGLTVNLENRAEAVLYQNRYFHAECVELFVKNATKEVVEHYHEEAHS